MGHQLLKAIQTKKNPIYDGMHFPALRFDWAAYIRFNFCSGEYSVDINETQSRDNYSAGPGEFPTQRPVTRSFDVFFHLSE